MTSNPDHSAAPRDLHGEDALIEEAYASPVSSADDLQDIENSVENLQGLAGQLRQQTAIPGKMLSPAASLGNPQFTQQLALNLDEDAAAVEPVIIENNPSGAAKKQEAKQESRKESQKPTASAVPPPAQAARRIRAGDVLREARLMRGWEIDAIAEEIKIKPSYLEAIEENRYSDLPSRTHAVGFARTYAQLMDINEDEIAKLMRHDVATALPSAAPNMAALEEKHRHHTGSSMPSSSLVIFCVALALFIYAVGYGFFRPAAQTENYPSITAALPETAKVAAAPAAVPHAQVNTPAPIAQQTAQVPSQQVPATATPVATSAAQLTSAIASYGQANPQAPTGDMPVVAAPSQAMPQALAQPILPQLADPASPAAQIAGAEASPASLPVARTARPSRIRLQALAPITVQIFDAGGHMLASRSIAKGEAFFIPDKTNYTMATNNAGALRLQVDGRDMPPLGAMEEPMHNIPLNADELLSALN